MKGLPVVLGIAVIVVLSAYTLSFAPPGQTNQTQPDQTDPDQQTQPDSIQPGPEQPDQGPGDDVLVPMSFPSRCIETYDQLAGIIHDESQEYGVPEELIAAIITAESSWDDNSMRYEPLFQVRFIDPDPEWRSDPAWITHGPTIRQWFSQHPDRQSEMSELTDAELDHVAQTRISSSYGLMQVLYTSAIPYCDYHNLPEGLMDIYTNVDCGTRAMRSLMDRYGSGDLVDAVSAYNAGEPSWQTIPHNRFYTEKVIGLYNAYLACGT
jgi:hypothetical protein